MNVRSLLAAVDRGRVLLFVCLAIACLPASAFRLTPEMVADVRMAEDAQISPSGAEVVYRLTRSRSAQEPQGGRLGELWMVSVSGGAASRLSDTGFSASTPRWSPDGSQLAWLARAEEGAAQIFVRRREGRAWGAVTQLTSVQAGVTSFEWSPDGSRIAFVAAVAQLSEQTAERDWIVFGEAAATPRLHTVRMDSGEVTLVTPANLTVWSFAWSPSGDAFAIGASVGNTDDDRCLNARPYVVSANGGVPRPLAEAQGMLTQVGWSPDGRSVTWLGSVDATDPRSGSVFTAAASGGSAPRNLTAGFLGTVTATVPMPRRDTLALASEEGAQTALHTLDFSSGRLEKIHSSAEIYVRAPSFSSDGKTFALVASSPRHPTEVFVGRSNGGELRRLTNSNPALAGVELGEQQVVRWHSKDGSTIEGVLVKPVGFRAGVRYPVVIHVHGGSELSAQHGWNAFNVNIGQLLAARGYLVLYPNYRGSSGRGTDFIRGNRRDLMGREWEDIESGLDHLIELGIADGARAGIYGHSWGGYAAGWGATWGSHRFKAAVAAAGIYNWISEAGSANTRMHEQIAHWDAPLYEHFPLYLERSPIYEIRKARSPVLLLHGERDAACPLTQAIEFHTALKWAKVPVQLVIYPREGHHIQERAHHLDYLQRSAAWFDRYLSPEAAMPRTDSP